MSESRTASFNQRLRRLSGWQQLAFATALAQRSTPNYLLFCEVAGWGDAEAFKRLLALLWEGLLARQSRINWAVQQEKLPALLPDPDAFDYYGVYPALDAVMALELAVEQAQHEDDETAIRASRLSRATVRRYLELQLPDDLDEAQQAIWLKQQPLLQDENAFQDELLAQLAGQFQPHSGLLRGVRELALNEGVSNLGICLDADEA